MCGPYYSSYSLYKSVLISFINSVYPSRVLTEAEIERHLTAIAEKD